MRDVALELAYQKSDHVYVNYDLLRLRANSSQDATIAILAQLHQRIVASARSENAGSPFSGVLGDGHPMRQPRGPTYLGELVERPTSKFEGSKNFIARQRRPFRNEMKKHFNTSKPGVSATQLTFNPKHKLVTTQAREKEYSIENWDDDFSFEDNPPPSSVHIVSSDGMKHSGNTDCVLRKRFVCVDVSLEKHLLSTCEDCTKGKKYYSFYKAALHLREVHLKSQARELEGGQLSTEVLKQWITEIKELVPEHLAPYDDFNYIEDDPQVQQSEVENKHILPVLTTESQTEKTTTPNSTSKVINETLETPENVTDRAKHKAVSSAIAREAVADANLKNQEFLLGESSPEERNAKPDTLDPVDESIDADCMDPYPCSSEALPPEVLRRNDRGIWALLVSTFTFISILILSFCSGHIVTFLDRLFVFEPYKELTWCAGGYLIGWIVLMFIPEPRPPTLKQFSQTISVPRNSQFTTSVWEHILYHIKLFIYKTRMRIFGNTAPAMGNRQKEARLPYQMRSSSLNPSIKLARSFKRAFLAYCSQVRIIISHFTRGRRTDTGKKRILSQCHCGHRFFDDYYELKDGAAVEYGELLQRRSPSSTLDRPSERKASSGWSSFKKGNSDLMSSFMSLIYGVAAFGNSRLERDDAGISLPQYRMENTGKERPSSPGQNDELLFLLLCVPHSQYATKLVQPQISAVRSDKDFFRLLRVNYQQMRGRVKRALSLKTLRSIKFVQLEMYKSELVDIRKHDDLPPEIKKDEYRYNPIPAEIIPPVGENHMLHLINHPSHAEEDGLLLDRIPKKLRERLLVCPSRGTGLGWGIYFIEGWHISVITLVAFAVVLTGSLAFLICWSVLKHDVQGASGVAAYMIAFLGLAIGSIQAVFELT